MTHTGARPLVSFAEATVENLASHCAFLTGSIDLPVNKGARRALDELRVETANLVDELSMQMPRLMAVHGPHDPPCRLGDRYGACWHEVVLYTMFSLSRASCHLTLLQAGDELRVRLAREAIAAIGGSVVLSPSSPLTRPLDLANRQRDIDEWAREISARRDRGRGSAGRPACAA